MQVSWRVRVLQKIVLVATVGLLTSTPIGMTVHNISQLNGICYLSCAELRVDRIVPSYPDNINKHIVAEFLSELLMVVHAHKRTVDTIQHGC